MREHKTFYAVVCFKERDRNSLALFHLYGRHGVINSRSMSEQRVTWDVILSFVKTRWSLTKKEISKYLHCSPSKLSRHPIKLTPEEVYAGCFQLRKHSENDTVNSLAFDKNDRESRILEDLADHLEKHHCSNDAKYIRESNRTAYQDVIMRILRSAVPISNSCPQAKTIAVKNEPLPTKEQDFSTFLNGRKSKSLPDRSPDEHLHELFELAVEYYGIAEFIRKLGSYLEGERYYADSPVSAFVESVSVEIAAIPDLSQNTETYKQITEFCNLLSSYTAWLTMLPMAAPTYIIAFWNSTNDHERTLELLAKEKVELEEGKKRIQSLSENDPASLLDIGARSDSISNIGRVIALNGKLCELFEQIIGKSPLDYLMPL